MRASTDGDPPLVRYPKDMPAANEDEAEQSSANTHQSQARQWSRAACGMALLFASLPAASRLFLGEWGFEGAAEISGLCLIVGTYLYFFSRRSFSALPDSAAILDQAIRLASEGRVAQAIALLSKAIRFSPWLWQAFQYRGELRLRQPETVTAAVEDFTEAIRLAPHEAYLYVLRGQTHYILGHEAAAKKDFERAAALGATVADPTPIRSRPNSDG
jgi:tetratricopeptide (TPR) repeat protein